MACAAVERQSQFCARRLVRHRQAHLLLVPLQAGARRQRDPVLQGRGVSHVRLRPHRRGPDNYAGRRRRGWRWRRGTNPARLRQCQRRTASQTVRRRVPQTDRQPHALLGSACQQHRGIMSISARLSRRKFIALTGAAAAQAAASSTLLYAAPTPPVAPRAGAQSLAGQWRFSLDRDDAGVKETWFASDLHATTTIALPGILQTQGYGDDIVADTQFIAALPRDMGWYKLPQYAAYTKPGAVEVPYLSQPVKHYLGVAWYQRDIDIPVAWRDKRVGLTLERTRWVTTVYVDDKEMGTCRSLVAPHDCDLGILTPGRHRLSICVDNRMQQPPYRYDAHSVSDAEGSTWNGIVGRIELAATSPVWIRDSAEAHGLLAGNKEIAHASRRFQVACYKEEIEASLRTASFSGYELLDLHDYLGQGGALIGVLDAFWESKGYVGPAEFRQYNNTTVPLTRFKDRVFTSDQTFASDVEVAHFGPKPLTSATAAWHIVDRSEEHT